MALRADVPRGVGMPCHVIGLRLDDVQGHLCQVCLWHYLLSVIDLLPISVPEEGMRFDLSSIFFGAYPFQGVFDKQLVQ